MRMKLSDLKRIIKEEVENALAQDQNCDECGEEIAWDTLMPFNNKFVLMGQCETGHPQQRHFSSQEEANGWAGTNLPLHAKPERP